MKFPLAHAMSSLVPRTVAKSKILAEKMMKDLIQILFENNHISAAVAEKAQSQCCKLTVDANTSLKDDFAQSDRKDHLDRFCYGIVGGNADYEDLFSVVRLMLTLSHDKAVVASGFRLTVIFLVESPWRIPDGTAYCV